MQYKDKASTGERQTAGCSKQRTGALAVDGAFQLERDDTAFDGVHGVVRLPRRS
jgi:hypothetical protein